jgi:hypothetical protein
LAKRQNIYIYQYFLPFCLTWQKGGLFGEKGLTLPFCQIDMETPFCQTGKKGETQLYQGVSPILPIAK